MDRFRRHRWLLLTAIFVLVVAGFSVALARTGQTKAVAASPPPATVSVDGSGSANGAPDTLSVDFTVNAYGSDIQTTLNNLAGSTNKVIGSLKHNSVANRDITTDNLDLYRRYGDHGVPLGYEANETVEARITPLAHAGATISDAADATNHIDVGNLNFDIEHDASLLQQARGNAFADAKFRAQQYASLSGLTLGRVVTISETVRSASPEPVNGDDLFAKTSSAGVSSVPIKSGTQSLTVNVKVVWQLT